MNLIYKKLDSSLAPGHKPNPAIQDKYPDISGFFSGCGRARRQMRIRFQADLNFHAD